MKKKQYYSEGHCFSVPIKNNYFAIGVISRLKKGIMLCHFFKSEHKELSSEEEIGELKPKNAILIAIIFTSNLINNKWPIIGKIKKWDRNEWSVPFFIRILDENPPFWKIYYDDNDPVLILEEVPCTEDEAKLFPKELICGPDAIVYYLEELI